jgi:hypothetical protein
MKSQQRAAHPVWFVFVITSLGVVTCARTGTPGPSPDAVAEILWLPAHAILRGNDLFHPVVVKNGRSIYDDGSGGVTFTISAECDTVAAQLVQHFAHTEWLQRSTQYLNPSLATSFNRGCQIECACVLQPGRTSPESSAQWSGEWENARGDIVRYTVGGAGQQLAGAAMYVPRHVVDEQRRASGH